MIDKKWISPIFKWLLKPSYLIEESLLLRRHKLQAAILLIFIFASASYSSLQLIGKSDYLTTFFLIQSTTVITTIGYFLNRYGYQNAAVYLSFGSLSLAIFLSVVLIPLGQNIDYLYVLILPIVLGAIVMTPRALITLTLFNSAEILLACCISPYITFTYALTPLECLLTISGLLLVFNRYRDRVEADRRREIEENEKQYRLLVENINDVIFRVDDRGYFTFISPAVERMSLYSIEEIHHQHFSVFIHPGDLPAVETHLEKVKNGYEHSIEFRALDKDERIIYLRSSCHPVRDSDNNYGITGIVTDISRQRLLEDQLRQSQKMESVGRLAGGIAHDFNNLLTVILGYCEMMLEDFKEQNESENNIFPVESVKGIETAAERAASLTQQLLTFSRKQTPNPKIININKVLENQEKMLRRLIGENIDLKFNYQQHLSLIKVDPTQMEQVIMNLAVNAAEAMPQCGKLIFETCNIHLDEDFCSLHTELEPGPHIMLMVRDTGFGIDKKNAKHIFDPFFTTKEPGKGTGLGLSTVYGIVKQNHGYIHFESEIQKGTTFYVYFPTITLSETFSQLDSMEGKSKSPHGMETLLVVEDEEGLREVISLSLEGYGYKVFSADSGETALNLLQQQKMNRLDLLITDVVMPNMNGKELAERIKRIFPNLKILYISGYTENIIQSHGIFTESVSFLPKPFSPILLTQKVRQMLNAE